MTVFDLDCAIERCDEATRAGELDGRGDSVFHTEWLHFPQTLAGFMQKRLGAQGKETYPNGMTPAEAVTQIRESMQLCLEKDPARFGEYTRFQFNGRGRRSAVWLLACVCALYDMAAAGRLKNCPPDIDPALLFLSTVRFWGWHDQYAPFAELDLKRMNLIPSGTDRKPDPISSDDDGLAYSEAHFW